MRASRYGATPKAKQGGGSTLLLFGVRAAPQRPVIQVPTAADASVPTSYPCKHCASLYGLRSISGLLQSRRHGARP